MRQFPKDVSCDPGYRITRYFFRKNKDHFVRLSHLIFDDSSQILGIVDCMHGIEDIRTFSW